MARHKATVRSLAVEAGLDVEVALLTLMEADFDVHDARYVLPKSRLNSARVSLGLSSCPKAASITEVSSLARRAGLDEAATRDRLIEAGVLRKRRLKRVPRGLLERAERTLGLRVLEV